MYAEAVGNKRIMKRKTSLTLAKQQKSQLWTVVAPPSSTGWAGKSPQKKRKVERGGSRDLGCRGAPVTAEMRVVCAEGLLRAATRG